MVLFTSITASQHTCKCVTCPLQPPPTQKGGAALHTGGREEPLMLTGTSPLKQEKLLKLKFTTLPSTYTTNTNNITDAKVMLEYGSKNGKSYQ